jgi:hypothetical protein
MKLIKIRLTDHIIVVNDQSWPLKHSLNVPSIGLTMSVRIQAEHCRSVVYGSLVRDGITHYAGDADLSSYREPELYRYVSKSIMDTVEYLKAPTEHAWTLIEQLPSFSHEGINIQAAEALERPVLDLVARGASPREIVSSLQISTDAYHLITGKMFPVEPIPQQATDDIEDIFDSGD